MPAPSGLHEDRRHVLDALAVLTGHTVELPELPDGRRPDVVRMNPLRRTLFLGDAKDTETARCTETQTRLLGYIRWLSETGAGGVLVVCFGHAADGARWGTTLSALAEEADLRDASVSVERLGRETWCAAVAVGLARLAVAGMGRGG